MATWAYDGTTPGPLIRATAGDFLRLTLAHQLPVDTTIHWHGIRLRNAADGVPGLTQNPVTTGGTFVYEFTAPDPGTYFFYPHVGVQLDRGLYAPLIIDDFFGRVAGQRYCRNSGATLQDAPPAHVEMQPTLRATIRQRLRGRAWLLSWLR